MYTINMDPSKTFGPPPRYLLEVMDPHNTCSIIYGTMTCMERKKSTYFCRSEEPMAGRVAMGF